MTRRRSDYQTSHSGADGAAIAEGSNASAMAQATNETFGNIESRPHKKPYKKHCRGFTLIEVLATMALLAIALPVTMQAISVSLAAASSARHMTEASALAQDQLNLLVATGDWNSATSGDFGTTHPGYNWKCENTDRDFGLSEVRLTIGWQERGQSRQFALSTLAQNGTNQTSTGTTSTSTGGIQGGLP